MTQLACIFHFFPNLSLLCNPSPLLPRYHSSSACKLSCSEPQCSPLSFGSLVFSRCLPHLASIYVPNFFKAMPFLHFMPFFQTFSCVFLRFFRSVLPAISSFPQLLPQFSLVFPSLPFIFSSIFVFFSTCSSTFLQPFATPFSASLLIPLQTVLLRTPTDAALR